MKIVIFTEAGSAFGYGHLSRCTALKQGFEEFGTNVTMYVRGDTTAQNEFVKTEWLDNFDTSLLENFDVVVIDSYHAPKKLYEDAVKKVDFGVWFDDTNRINYPTGRIIDGKNSVVLRKAFWGESNLHSKKNAKFFISFGGTDKKQEVSKIVKEIRKKNLNASFIFASEVPDEILSVNDIILTHADENSIAEAMKQCSKAVSAGGQTLLELAALGIPTVAVIIAENQIGSSKRCMDAHHILGLVDITDTNWTLEAVSLLNKDKKIIPIEVQTKSIANDILNEVKQKK